MKFERKEMMKRVKFWKIMGVAVLSVIIGGASFSQLIVKADSAGMPIASTEVLDNKYSTLLSERFSSYKANANIDVMKYKSQVDPMTAVASNIVSAKIDTSSSIDDIEETLNGMQFGTDGYAVLLDSNDAVVYDPSSKADVQHDVLQSVSQGGYYASYDAETGAVRAVGSSSLDGSDYSVAVVVNYPVMVDAETAKVEPASIGKRMYATSNVNVRKGPSTETDVVAVLGEGDPIMVTDSSTAWCSVEYDGRLAFVATEYLTEEVPAEQIGDTVVPAVEDVTDDEEVVDDPVVNESEECVQEAPQAIEVQESYDGIVQADGAVSAELLRYANGLLGRVPSSVLNAFQQDGWSIYVTDSDLDNRYYGGTYGKLAGITVYDDKSIYMEDSKSDINRALAHEFGHYLDSTSGFPSTTQQFMDIYNEEKYTFLDSTSCGDGHEYSDPQEFYASVFSEAMINPEGCQSTAPKAYAYICDTLNSLED